MEAVHFKLSNYKYREPTSAHWPFISHFTEQTLWQANKLSAKQKFLQVLWNLKVHVHTTFSEPVNLQQTIKTCF